MKVLSTSGWEDYSLIDSGDGQRLEKFGKYLLIRPDPQAIWKKDLKITDWENIDAIFTDKWQIKTSMPEKWIMNYEDVSFYAKLTPFKHTGVFPEQKIHWDYIREKIKSSKKEVSLLNLFGYTGVTSLIAAKSGAKVTHVDASRPAVTWLKENESASKLDGKIRVIVDDVLKFINREIKRGNKYDCVVMDPPAYGHDPQGGVWDFNKNFPTLIEGVSKILSSEPLFVIVNTYAISSSAIMLENVMKDYLPSGKIESGELALKEKDNDRLLSTGIFGIWEK